MVFGFDSLYICFDGHSFILSFSDQPTVTNQKYSSFIFKCQRDKRNDHGSNVYSVNAIAFHNLNTFCTAGSDGVFCFWDKVARHRLRALEKHKGRCPITSICYSPNGSMLFYAMSYDWSRGAENNNANYGNNIYAHVLQDDEVKPKGK